MFPANESKSSNIRPMRTAPRPCCRYISRISSSLSHTYTAVCVCGARATSFSLSFVAALPLSAFRRRSLHSSFVTCVRVCAMCTSSGDDEEDEDEDARLDRASGSEQRCDCDSVDSRTSGRRLINEGRRELSSYIRSLTNRPAVF